MALQNRCLVEYDGTMTYVGVAPSDRQPTDHAWMIKRIEKDAVGKVIGIAHAGGVGDQIWAWTERKNLEYK